MKAPPEHLPYLRRQNYILGCSRVFTDAEHDVLVTYGHWLEALTSGAISPVTPEEERFIRVALGELEPETSHELAWVKLQERRKFEADERNSAHYRVYDEAEAWSPRSENWRCR